MPTKVRRKGVIIWRCTRNWPYRDSPTGKHNLGARQGFYLEAKNEKDALRQMAKRFPADIQVSEDPFTVKRWSG